MHQALINDILVHTHYGDAQALSHKVRRLKPANDALMQGFRSNQVQVNWGSSDARLASVIRYFPIYAQPIQDTLKAIKQLDSGLLFSAGKQNICLIGCGPCPEIVGILNYSKEHEPEADFRFHGFDLNNGHWSLLRKKTLRSALPAYPAETFGHTFDLCKPNAVRPHMAVVSASRMVVVQNCLNEMGIEYLQVVTENIKEILHCLAGGSRMVFIDIANYPMTQQVLWDIQRYALENNTAFTVELGFNCQDRFVSHNPGLRKQYPVVLENNGLYLKDRTTYVRLCIRKH